MTNSDLKNLVEYWLDAAEADWKFCQAAKNEKTYAHRLFFLHLSIEKKLKAIIVKRTATHAPFSHSLGFLAGRANIEVSRTMLSWLEEISSFNMDSRYPDKKFEFYKLANKRFFNKWVKIAKEIHHELDKEFQKSR